VIFDVLASPAFDITVFVIPYGAFIVHFITFILTAIVLVRERTSGTLSRMFVSGYTPIEIIGGYLVAYTSLATIQSLLVITELNFLFDLGYDLGQLASFYLTMWLLAVISLALGTLVSNFARNEGQVFPFIPVILLSFILSGILLPVEQLPDWAHALAYLTPLFYTNEVLQSLISGNTLSDDWSQILYLILFGLGIMMIAMFTLREKD
jgi:ABC-2 type transport system permease protein